MTSEDSVCPEYVDRMALSTLISPRIAWTRGTSFWMFVIFVTSIARAGAADNRTMIDALLSIDQEHSHLCSESMSPSAVQQQISRLADEIRVASVDRPTSSDAGALIRTVNEVLFGPDGLRSSQDLHNPCNLLVSGVLARGQGYCVGIAGIYLGVAEELGLPVFAVATPSHVFLRYDDGATRINIETDGGTTVPDARYIEQQRIAPDSLRRGIFMMNMPRDAFLAHVRNNLGVIASERGDFVRARAEYEAALSLDRRLPAAWYNLGKDMQAQGRHREAVRALTRAIELHPNDTWALNNRAMSYGALHKPAKARRDLEEALRIDPGFDQARQNRERLPP